MTEDIGYTEGKPKIAPEIMDAEIQEMKQESIKKLEKAAYDRQVRAEAGMTDIPSAPESIPKELPKMAFKIGAKIISCDRFNLDDEEAKVMAKHLSILIGAVSVWWYSLFIVFIILVSKISDCWSALGMLLGRKKKDEAAPTTTGTKADDTYKDYI